MARPATRYGYGLFLLVGLSMTAVARADGPADNNPDTVRRVPNLGIELADAERQDLTQQLATLQSAIDELAKKNDPLVRDLLPDVQIFHRAVHDALTYREFLNEKEPAVGRDLLKQGLERARQLAAGEAPWTTQTGLVVRGYVSRIDGSVQPYGLVVPESFTGRGGRRMRLDLWFHGRGETLTELNFLAGRQKDRGVFTPDDTIVLHPYGRYCNAFKFAGEVDVLEALESVRRRYPIDEDRIASRGFSMGGAACWQFAVHYSDRWVGATPGAGFSETPDFLKVFQKETLNPNWWERKLWHWYDCNDWALNLAHCPTIAYSGENDSQKQAADIMVEALRQHGIELVHIIGPKTGHSYHPEARAEIERRMNTIALRGRERLPKTVRFVTYTLKYNRQAWVTVDAMGEHWSEARVEAQIIGDGGVSVSTKNVTALTLDMPAGWAPFDVTQPVSLQIDGQDVRGPRPASDRSWTCRLVRDNQQWQLGTPGEDRLRKRHDLQGPIDDAFMDSFVFVRPSGTPAHPAVAGWVKSEQERAQEHWRRHFRGVARVKDDNAVTDADIANSNLVLWGDPASNTLLAKIAERLPIRWNRDTITAGGQSFPADQHALVLVYPNPLNPRKYVVLNSGFTFRDYDYLNNARQVARLPDWAIVDLRTPPGSQWPGKIATAGFFNELWELKPAGSEGTE
ncbi:MAG: prolyl oligopeptidase family serine peptidase [Planctomycetes bacterium]|nr:prolyl oligopeptidase family serine peptidase [Planctomycetota bacterium]